MRGADVFSEFENGSPIGLPFFLPVFRAVHGWGALQRSTALVDVKGDIHPTALSRLGLHGCRRQGRAEWDALVESACDRVVRFGAVHGWGALQRSSALVDVKSDIHPTVLVDVRDGIRPAAPRDRQGVRICAVAFWRVFAVKCLCGQTNPREDHGR